MNRKVNSDVVWTSVHGLIALLSFVAMGLLVAQSRWLPAGVVLLSALLQWTLASVWFHHYEERKRREFESQRPVLIARERMDCSDAFVAHEEREGRRGV